MARGVLRNVDQPKMGFPSIGSGINNAQEYVLSIRRKFRVVDAAEVAHVLVCWEGGSISGFGAERDKQNGKEPVGGHLE